MSPWRLEALRLWRTRRLVALFAPFVLLGLGIPVLTKELPAIAKHGSNGVTVIVPRPTPADALNGFAQNAAQLGTLVLVLVAAASLAIDAQPALAAFYRTRLRRSPVLVVPRHVSVSLAGVVALAIGIVCVWFETDALIGRLPLGAVAQGFGLEILWIVFSVSVVTFWASVARGIPGVAGMSLATLLAIAFLSAVHALSQWAPTALASSLTAFVGVHRSGLPWRSLIVTVIASAGFVVVGTLRLGSRSSE